MNDYNRGVIRHETAYAQGKMVDHQGWVGALPRKISPSDIDMALDNDGWVLLIELAANGTTLLELPTGQRRLFESLVRAGRGNILAALWHHDTPPASG
jgi:hypothetical protein